MEILVYSWAELVAVCGTAARAKIRIRDGLYRRVMRNAYVLGDVPDSPAVRAAALAQVLPEHAVATHWTALWALGLDVLQRDATGRDLLDVTVPPEHHLSGRAGLRWCSALLTDDDLVEVNGVIISSAARAFVEIARRDGITEGVAAGDAALRAGVTTLDRIDDSLGRAAGLPWVTRAREAVPHLDERSESLMESRLRVGFVLAGGPRMRTQIDLYDDEGNHRGRSDLFLDGVSIEYDGRESRLEKVKFTGDRSRGNGVADLEVEVRRFTGDLFYKSTPAERLDVLMKALKIAARRTRPRLRFGQDTLRPPKLRPLPTRTELAQARRTA
jgi:hypothetical protein